MRTVQGKEDPKDDASNRDSIKKKSSASGSNGEDRSSDISMSRSQITPPKGQVRISITNSDSAVSEEDTKQVLDQLKN